MKHTGLALFLFLLLFLPSYISAEENDTYLIYASEEEIEQIKQEFGSTTTEFLEIPLVELNLSEAEKTSLQEKYQTAEIYPNRQYETAADTVSPTFTTTKSSPTQAAPYTGKGVRVGILDTGIDTEHPDLTVAGGVCVAEVCSSKIPYDDNFGHGTHVAGVIAAKKNNIGIVGMAPNVTLFSIKAMDDKGGGTTADITKGVEWAIRNKMDILNLSISISVNDQPLELMLKEAYKQGMTIVAAAGNEGGAGVANTVTYPGKYSSVIAVGALNADSTKELNSSIGPEMELSAPGYNIFSTFPKELDDWDYVVDGYRELTGTSMAAPHVTGVLALYKEQHPGLSNIKLREILQTTAKDLGTAGRDGTFGFGLVQYEKEIKTVPFISTKITKGEVIFTLKNKELATGWALTENGKPVPSASEGVWKAYKTKGKYTFNFSYTDLKGVKKAEVVTATIALPAFPDVTKADWYAPHISYLYSKNMMNGYLDGTFKPVKEISRGEAMILLGKARGLDGTPRNTVFKDVGINNGASGYIQSAYDKGIIKGFPDETFKPEQMVTRAEMALLIQNTYNFTFDPLLQTPFTDVSENQVSYSAIQALTQQNITSGYTATTFEPDKFMNRYAFSVFLARSQNQPYFSK